MMFEALLGIIAQHQPNDAGCDGEHARLRRNVLLHVQVLGNGVCRQQPGDRGQSQLSEQLLLDTEHRLGVHLPERERVALEQLVKLLDPGKVGQWEFSEAVSTVAAVVEALISIGVWVPKTRRMAVSAGLAIALAFALGLALGAISPETCGCFGRVLLSNARHNAVIGSIICLSSILLLTQEGQQRK